MEENVVENNEETVENIENNVETVTIPTLKEVIDSHIINTLKHYNWNRTHTAVHLGMGIRTLQRRLTHMAARGYAIQDNPNAAVHIYKRSVALKTPTRVIREPIEINMGANEKDDWIGVGMASVTSSIVGDDNG